jgi:CubicO group peptidase (beta-lactamase class C family)
MHRTACALALTALFLAVPALANEDAAIARIEAKLPPRIAIQGAPQEARSLADEMRRLKVPGVSVAVIRGGKLAWARGYGVTHAGGPAVTPQTLFQAASLSKSVTGLAVMRMVEAGKLDLDADVNTMLGSWKLPPGPGAGKVSVRQLLSHTGGTTVSGFPGYAAGTPVPSVTQVLDGVAPANTAPVRVQTAPGSAWAYSGGGYTVVQLAMTERSGKPFPALLDEIVLKPLGMRDSSFVHPLPASLAPRAGQPHERSGQAYAGGPFLHPELAAAGLWTTPSDMARFAIAVQDALAGRAKGFLSAPMARPMLEPVQPD